MNTQQLKELLIEFGLDPLEWELEITRRIGELFHCEIRSRLETLCFDGWAENDRWLALSLRPF